MKFTNKTKLLALLMALMLMITAVFVGCGSEDKKDDDKKDETTVAEEKETEADKDEDKNTDVDEDTDEDEDDFPQPGTEGFTLEELQDALETCVINGDLSYLEEFSLSETDAILEYMLANDASAGNEEFIDENGYNSITDLLGYFEIGIPENVDASLTEYYFSNDGSWGTDEYGYLNYGYTEDDDEVDVHYEEGLDFYVQTYAPDYYDVAAEAVANAYANSGENVEFVGLSFVVCDIYAEDGIQSGQIVSFIIETNTGWFFLTETL